MDLTDSALEPEQSIAPGGKPLGRLSRATHVLRRLNWIFFVSVALPTTLSVVYYGFMASNIYISESRFLVRSPQHQAQSGGVGALLFSSAFGRSQDDSYAVRDFILSRDALQELDQRLAVRKAYGSREIGVFDRFPGLDWDESFEALFRYYRLHVAIEYDPVSSISVLTVRSPDPKLARDINSSLLGMAERLVNQLNERSRSDLIQVAEQEVKAAEQRTADAALALSGFRNRQSIFEPEKQSMLQLQGIAKLQDELLATQTQLAQVLSLSPSNPQVTTLRNRVEVLQKAIDSENGKIAGSGGSLSSKSMTFERLALEKEFAQKQLTLALSSLESARNEAERKQLYLERLVWPNFPDHPLEPRRLRAILTVIVFSFVVWGLLSLIVASIREHAD